MKTYQEMQRMINSGLCWRLEGAVGREAMRAIEDGFCMLGGEGVKDYWGNYVPARSQVVEGSKGSYGYVAERQGHLWAEAMERVP